MGNNVPEFWKQWRGQSVPSNSLPEEKPMPITIYELAEENNIVRAIDITLKSATMKRDNRTYNIPIDMALAVLEGTENGE